MEKEKTIEKYYETISVSWTYAKLTEQEKERLSKLMFSPCIINSIKGTHSQRWSILNAIYHSFLVGLNYDPINWREEKKEEKLLF